MSWSFCCLLVLIGLVVSAWAERWPSSGSCEPCKCTTSNEGQETVKYVNCFNLSLTEVPLNVPGDMDVLDLSNNKLQSDQLTDLQEFPLLQYLSLAYNNITMLEDSPFSKLAQLTFLKLTGNRITKVTKKSFIGLENLNTLHGLKVEDIDPQSFIHLQQLKVLELEIRGNIPQKLFDGMHLETLNITFLRGSEFPSDLFVFGSSRLKDVSITAPSIRKLQKNLLRPLASLRRIRLELPRLIDMPSTLFNIPGADLQDVQLHKIQNLPSGLFHKQHQLLILGITRAEELNENLFDKLTSLRILELKQTFISIIPQNWFARTNNLVFLSLKETSLRRLNADSFTGLTQLKTLDLSLNSLRVIPKGVFKPMQKSLKLLDLSGNILKKIELGALDGMSSLDTLELNDNKMASLQNGLFDHLVHLSSLNLQENKLSSLPDQIFSKQKRLSILNLASNSFSELPKAILRVSKRLTSLDLSYNQMLKFGNCTANRFPNLEFLSLSSNPLHCSCNLLLLKQSQPSLDIEGMCISPEEFENQQVAKVSMPDRCFSEVCDLAEESLPDEPPDGLLPAAPDLMGSNDSADPVVNTKPLTKSDMTKVWSTPTVVLTESTHAVIVPSTPFVDRANTEDIPGVSNADANLKTGQGGNKQHSPGASINASGASAAASVYKSVEFRSVIGTVAGCLFLLVCAVLVYMRQKHQRQMRFTLRQRIPVTENNL